MLGLCVIAAACLPAAAQQTTTPSPPQPAAVPPPPPSVGPQIIVTPFLALTGINSAISTPLARAPVVDSSVGAFQLLGHLDGVPFAGAVEISDGPFSLLGETLHVPVGTDVTTHNIFFSGGNAALTANEGTADLLYHVLAEPAQSLDAGVGFRAWSFTSDLTLNGRIVRTVNLTRSAEWADPLLAVRYHHDFGRGFGVTAYADFGGFGVAAHTDWQVLGTIDYAWTPWATLRLGYVSLNFNYTAGNDLGFDVHMKGPLLAAAFRF